MPAKGVEGFFMALTFVWQAGKKLITNGLRERLILSVKKLISKPCGFCNNFI